VFGLHNDTTIPMGQMTAVEGAVSAHSDRFWIHISGKGGHAARPQRAIDPVVIGSHIVLALQSIVARRTDALDSAVISITQFHAGSAGNVIPDEANLNGTVRTLKTEVQETIEPLMRQIIEQTAAAHGATATLDYTRGYPPVVNHADATDRAARAAARIVGAENVIRRRLPGMGGEDFSYMAQKVPGCFVRVGQAAGDKGTISVHHPKYDFNDDILPLGASLWATLVEQELPRG
jgi:hippurate hydrolase